MSTLRWYAVILWTWLRCRLGGHQDTVRTGHGYVVTWCSRCYRHHGSGGRDWNDRGDRAYWSNGSDRSARVY